MARGAPLHLGHLPGLRASELHNWPLHGHASSLRVHRGGSALRHVVAAPRDVEHAGQHGARQRPPLRAAGQAVHGGGVGVRPRRLPRRVLLPVAAAAHHGRRHAVRGHVPADVGVPGGRAVLAGVRHDPDLAHRHRLRRLHEPQLPGGGRRGAAALGRRLPDAAQLPAGWLLGGHAGAGGAGAAADGVHGGAVLEEGQGGAVTSCTRGGAAVSMAGVVGVEVPVKRALVEGRCKEAGSGSGLWD